MLNKKKLFLSKTKLQFNNVYRPNVFPHRQKKQCFYKNVFFSTAEKKKNEYCRKIFICL